jgi:phage terminase small subunit
MSRGSRVGNRPVPHSDNFFGRKGNQQMAGVKGKSGGPRQNSGGARPGAGRKPQEPPKLESDGAEDAKTFLIGVMTDAEVDARLRIDAAKALLPYQHQKIGEAGKKEGKQAAAKVAGAGRFAPAVVPLKLVAR